MNKKISQNKFQYTAETFISTLLSSYFLVTATSMLLHVNDGTFYTDLSFLQGTDDKSGLAFRVILIACVAFVLTLVEYLFPSSNITPHVMFFSALGLAMLLMHNKTEAKYYTYIAVMFVMSLVILYTVKKGCFSFIKSDISPKVMYIAAGALVLVCGFFVAGAGVYRYLTYSTPNYDFGLFCNMFHNMKETGLPTVSCERDAIMSHFAVHFSPIYYLMLPIFFIFPDPATLQILQVVVLYSGIIPLILLCRKKGISSKVTAVISLIFASFPAIAAGTFYDLHENCFLVPLLLWVFYFYETKKYIPMAVFAVLTLLVKEDAFMYLIFFAVYVLIADKQWKIAIPTAAFSLVYFLVVSSLMNKYGDGIMVNRFDNMIYDPDDGLLGAVKTVIVNPGYALSQLFVAHDGGTGKLLYLVQLLLPLGFMPFVTKKLSRYLLLCPILLNTLTMYRYQPDISFQYSFGIIAFLFYASVLNISELSGFFKKYLLCVGAVASILLFALVCIPRFSTYYDRYNDFRETYDRYDHALEEVLPEDASVTASSFFIAKISDRAEIYEVNYHKDGDGNYKTDTDFIVLDMRYADDSKKAYDFYIENGYEEFYVDEGFVTILKKSA